MYQVSCVLPTTLVPLVLSKFLVEHITSQYRLLILGAPCKMEAPWLPPVSIILEDIFYHFPTVKDFVRDIL